MEGATGTALWHRDGEAPLPLRWALLRDPSAKRQPFALCCTDQNVAVLQLIAWYVGRWEAEGTCEEVRAHLGFATQRHWSARAVGRTTPCLLGLFSVVLLIAGQLEPLQLATRPAAWYAKVAPPFAAALAAVRRRLWAEMNSPHPLAATALVNSDSSSTTLLEMLVEAACYAA
jgi:hypothetical protein